MNELEDRLVAFDDLESRLLHLEQATPNAAQLRGMEDRFARCANDDLTIDRLSSHFKACLLDSHTAFPRMCTHDTL